MMKLTLKLLLLGILLTGQNCYAQKSSEKSIPLIVVKEQDNGVVFEKIFIAEGQIEVIADPSVISIILPLSEGTAANIAKYSDRDGVIIVKNNNGQMSITFRSSNGKEKGYPSVSYDDLKTFQTRVNIINGKGYKQAFIIDNYDIIKEDDGPVIDLFRGMIPLEANDYSITLETKINNPSKLLTGSFPFVKIDSWIVAEAKLPNGKTGRFIIDTGASGSLVLKESALPENTKVSELKAVSYSGEGSTEKEGQMQGGTGVVEDENFLGVAQLSSFGLGDIHLSDLRTSVLKELPEFLQKHNIIGIVGIEILKQAKIIRIENINKGKGIVKFISQENKQSDSFNHHFSLNTAGNLLFLKGAIQEVSIDYLIDIGARRSMIGSSIVTDNNISYSILDENAGIVGIDGKGSDAIEGEIPEIKLENDLFKEVPFLIGSDLFITKTIGLEKSGVILGMSFFSQFSTMEIDFVNSKIYLEN